MKAVPHLSLLFRDPGRIILLDRSGCVYNLNLRDKECSCGEESDACVHFQFANKQVSTSRCPICLRNNTDGEALCLGCFSLYHQDCVDRRKAYGMRVCLTCGLEWSIAALRLCYFCGCQVKGTAAICAFCPGMDICLACYQTTKHSHQAYVMEDEGLIKTPHGDPILGYLPLLLNSSDELNTTCIACETMFGSLALLKCGHALHLDCLALSIRQRKMNCVACLSPFFRGISRTLSQLARKPPAVMAFRSLNKAILSQVNKSVEYSSRDVSPTAIRLKHIGVSVTPKAGKLPCDFDSLPPITPLKLKNFHFGGETTKLMKRTSITEMPQPSFRPQRDSSKKVRKQRDLSILNITLSHNTEALFTDWNKLPGRFLSRTKGIKKCSHLKPSPAVM